MSFLPQHQPERIERFPASNVLALPGFSRTDVQRANRRSLLGDIVFYAPA